MYFHYHRPPSYVVFLSSHHMPIPLQPSFLYFMCDFPHFRCHSYSYISDLQRTCLCPVLQCWSYHCSVHLPLDLYLHSPVAQHSWHSLQVLPPVLHSVGDFRIQFSANVDPRYVNVFTLFTKLATLVMNWIERDIGPIVRKTSNNSDVGAIALVHYDDKPGTHWGKTISVCDAFEINRISLFLFSLCQGWGAARNFFTASSDSLLHPPLSLVFVFQSSSSHIIVNIIIVSLGQILVSYVSNTSHTSNHYTRQTHWLRNNS